MTETAQQNSDKSGKSAAHRSALASLARREHSRLELQNKLLNKGFEHNLVEQLLDDLEQQGWLCDTRFAEVFCRMRSGKGYGELRIRQELQQKGVARSVIEQTLNRCEVDFYQVMNNAYAKKYDNRPVSDFKEKTKRQAFLYRRGFAAEMIAELLD